ncbi:MAG TPA: helix-turn-helix transcriptional regulator [Ktedonobacterales bacterium]|jgi:hypothetical protein
MIDLFWEAQLHKETYSAVLNSALKPPGTKQSFAEQVGISPQYLSYLLDPNDPRTPGPAVAQKIAAASPLDPEQRASLFEHLFLASQRRLERERSRREVASHSPLTAQVAMLGYAHHLACASTDHLQIRPRFLAVRDASQDLLKQVNPHVAALAAIQICFILSDTQCILNRPDDALYHAKLARLLIHSLDENIYRSQREYIDRLEFHAIRAEAVAYHNLKLPRRAYACCEEADTTRAIRERPEECKPHLLRDKLNALSHSPRFTLREAEDLAREVSSISQRIGGADGPIWEFLVQRSLGRAYLKYGAFTKARRVFEALLNDLHRIPHMEPLHKTVFLNTYAKLLWQQGYAPTAQQARNLALSLAEDPSITPQFAELRDHSGPTMGPFLRDLHLLPTEEAAEEAAHEV